MVRIAKKIARKIIIYFKKKGILTLHFKEGALTKIKNHYCFQTRAESTIKMILEAITTYNNSKLSGKIVIFAGDRPNEAPIKADFYYCSNNKKDIDKLLPDFIFGNWPQIGIHNYDETAKQIMLRGGGTYKIPKMLWIGNSQTHTSRVRFLEIAQNYPELIDGIDTRADKVILNKTELPYISLEDHTNYKYLIDIEGNGYSARIGLLLFSQRVVFMQERQWKQYYLFDLEPYKHYIPVKNDFSDLIDKIKEVESKGEDFYNEIAQNALKFAQENLMYKNAVERIQKIMFDNKK